MSADPALLWLVGGIVLLVLEILVPGIFLMWLGLAALGTGLVVQIAGPDISGQVIAFAVFAAVAIAAALRVRRSRQAAGLNTAESGLLGRPARILSVSPSEIRVRIGDTDWPARLAKGTPSPEAGATLRVVAVHGTTVVVGDGPIEPAGGEAAA
jgi:membrane protein implicated in regulation of membrane protease activity